MTLTFAETIVISIILTFPGFVRSQPLIIDENTAPGYVLLTKTCRIHPLVLENETAIPWKYFEVNSTSAPNYQITLKQRIDAGQDTDSCWPKATWTSKGYYTCNSNQRVGVDIRVGHVNNEFPPTFCNKSALGCVNITSLQVSVREDARQNSDIIKILMCDMDVFKANNKPPTLAITNPFFSYGIEIEDGFKVLLKQTLDYEIATQHVTNITVDDGIHSAYTMALTVNVVDVDDQGPAFNSSVYHCNISERMYKSRTTSGCVVQANDKDICINATIEYEIIPSFTGKVQFSISNTGNIQVQGQLDRETMSTYILPVKGYQRNRKADRFDIATVIFKVTDVNDNLPTFATTVAHIRIIENSPVGTLVYQFTATDLDEGPNAIFTYRLDDRLGAFKLDTEGRLIVNDSGKLDREKQTTPFIITVYADPAGKALDSNPNATLTITLLDVNDNSPSFPQGSYETTIFKTHLVGTTILTLTASDPDLGPNGILKYSWQEEPDESTFSIVVETGEVKLKRNLTEHFRNVYHLIVKAEDNATNPKERRSSSVSLIIHVKDVNDHTPNIVILESKNISENAAPGTTVAWLTVTDDDSDDNLTVSITSGNRDGAFNITLAYPPVYMITATRKLDRETHNMYQLLIICSDGIHISTSIVNIWVLDENDNSPVIKGRRNFTTTENKDVGEHIGTITATDADEGRNAALIFSIDPESPWNANFSINSTSGLIRSTTSLDRDVLGNRDTIHFLVYVVDNGDIPLTGSATITVTIHDLDDNAPVFEQANVTLTVNELHKPGLIYTTTATDLDIGENKKIIFRIGKITPPSSTLFELSTDGQLKNNRIITFDDSTDGVITIKVMAIDQGPHTLSSTQVITLHINDVNNHLPTFQKNSYHVNISETSEPGYSLIRVSAIDMDRSPSNNKITYWLNDTLNNTFRIDPTSGEVFLVTNVDLDVSSPRTEYTLEVFASDNVPYYSTGKIENTSVSLSVHVEYVNEYAPVFEKASYTCPVDENVNGLLNCFVKASDLDRGKDGTVHFDVISHNTTSSIFKVSNTTGQLYLLNSFDYETITKTEFNITISASDSGNPPKRTYSQVTIEVQNINDCTPRLRMRSSISISENIPLARGLPLLELAATDEDGDLNHLSYFIIPPSNIFSVHNDKTIVLSGKLEFDYETQAQYQFNVVVSDSKFNSSRPFSIRVTPMNEFAPVFNQSYIFDVAENSVSHHSIQADDADKGGNDGTVSYALEFLGNDDISRNINITKGGMLTISNLDRESVANVSFTVLAVDGGKLSLTGMTTIVVNIKGTDDNRPYYTDDDKDIKLTVDENRAYPNIFTSVALDKDVGVGSDILYRLVQRNTSLFSVSSDGQLSINPLSLSDGEEIQIEAYNPTNKAHKAIQRIHITVQDINDNVPQFTSHSYNVSIDETTEPDSNIINVTAVDTDSSLANNKITYWLTDTYRGMFRIDPTTGEVFIARSADLDVPIPTTHYPLQVFASDMTPFHNGSMTFNASAPLDVYILHSNEYAPAFDKAHYTCTVEENYEGPLNCFMQTTDLDSGSDGHIAYSVVNSSTNHFTINQTTGQINLKYRLDYENPKEREFNMTITAIDHGTPPKVANADVRVVLTNLNDNAPVFNMKTSISFSENFVLPQGMVMFELGATDRDGDIDHLSYEVKSLNDMFVVHDNKTIILNPSLQNFKFDYETTPFYTLTVSYTDSHYLESTKLNISITPVNEFKPVFKENYTMFVPENSVWTGTIQAEDLDAGFDGKVFYALEYPERASRYGNITVSPEGNLTIANLDREAVALFTFVALATDGGNPAFTGMTTIEVVVQGIDDNPPYYREQEKHMYVSVKAGIEYRDTFTSGALDDDIGFGSSISYRLSTGNPALFTVSPQGQLSIRPLTSQDGGEIQIEAFNPTNPTHTAIQTVKIIVQ